MLTPRWPSPLTTLLRQTARPSPSTPLRTSYTRSLCTSTPTRTFSSRSFLRSYRAALALSLTVSAVVCSTASPLDCASDRSAYAQKPALEPAGGAAASGGEGGRPVPKEAESILNLRDLGFGTVSGICVGVFVKKGLKAVAFALGGAFIFLQYLSSRSLISVNWSGLASSYDSFITKRAGPPAAQGGNRLAGLWRWFVDFVSADVQARGTFVAGLALGLRVG